MGRMLAIGTVLLAISLLMVPTAAIYFLWPWVMRDVYRLESGSMENGDINSIDEGDLIRIEEADSVVSYIQGEDTGYRRAGSFGDVLVFHPNGNVNIRPIIHRVVIWMEFNATDYNVETQVGGGYDIPSMDLWNHDGPILIEDYDWPRRPEREDIRIDIQRVLSRFRNSGVHPHSGYVTKGDDNPGVDQTSDFFGPDIPWIEPIQENWIIGKYASHAVLDARNIPCCLVSMIIPILALSGIVMIVSHILISRKREKAMKNNAPPVEEEQTRPGVENIPQNG
ncbi:MAG: S26 family signal peptidase [Thermoplasmatota archaeon]